jgi:simple sugar transport system substrate-binding protein
MRKLFSAAAVVAATLAATTVAYAQEKLKVGFIYVGPVGDFGWSYQHDQARQAIEKKFAGKIETSYLESVPENDSERAIEQLARTGHNLIFTTSFGYMEPTLNVAKKFPKVKFEHATGFKRADNVSTYAAKFHEGRYIIGQIAGKTTKTNTIGYIVSFPIPEVVAGVNAFMLGAQSVNPNLKVKIVWVNSWFDPGKEADAAKALIAQGADVLVQHTDSAAAMQEAEKAGVHAFGQASDMAKFGPKAQLSAIVDDWTTYYSGRVQAALEGTWKSTDTWGGLAEDMVHMAAYANMPDDVKKMAEETQAAIKSGKLNPFKGPIYKQDGTLVVKEGESLSDKDVLSMNWYVKGVDDKLPQ